MEIKLATVNSLFDGVSVQDLTASDWMIVHAKTFAGNVNAIRKYQKIRAGNHPVMDVIEAHKPDIIIVNEVIKYKETSETIKLLKEREYKGVELDAAVEVASDFKRGTLVACRYAYESINLDVQRFPGGRFSGMKIPELNLIVIGVQGTPFNWLIRKHQINSILSYFKQFTSEGYKVIVAGDFNTGIRNSDLTLPDGISHFTERTFPSPGFYQQLCADKSMASRFMRTLLKLRKGPRSLDHVLYCDKLKLLEGNSFETSSDHCALLTVFDA